MSWSIRAEEAQQAVLDSIPPAWRLPSRIRPGEVTDVSTIIEEEGLLSARQLQLTSKDVTELASQIKSGELTALEVCEAFCARAALAHQLTNCLTCFFPDEALKEAARLDKVREESGTVVGPLHGIPVAIKDTYHVTGKPSTLGYVSLRDNIAGDDAVVVRLLREAGAVIHCKTTMPQTGMALETSSNLWGRTLNPFNTNHGAGGSSGGDGALIAMRGSPVTPMTDIGGSIRAPAAFNGLYAIRPTADRIPKTGLHSWNPGQMSIRVSCGPASHSARDLQLVTPVMNAFPNAAYDISCIPVPWRSLPLPTKKLKFGLLEFDGVVTPHPPIIRALRETSNMLRAVGHEIAKIELPFSAWEVAQNMFKLYFQTGAAEAKAMIAASGEPTLPVFQHYLDVFNIKTCSTAEVFQLNRDMVAHKLQFRDWWDMEQNDSSDQQPFDAIICPVAPSQSIPHGFPIWWGYTSLWNYLDYPSTVVPCKNIRLDPAIDTKPPSYVPIEGVADFDKMNWELYEPESFAKSPIAIQIVGRPFRDEDLLNITEVVDNIINDTRD